MKTIDSVPPLLKPEMTRDEERAKSNLFRLFAQKASHLVGSSWAFILAVTLIVVWAATYKLFGSFDTWQLVINTATTIITFLMVFLIQNTQNRDAKAIHLKLNELLRAVHGARTGLVNLENLTDEELDRLEEEFRRLRCREEEKHGGPTERRSDEREKKSSASS